MRRPTGRIEDWNAIGERIAAAFLDHAGRVRRVKRFALISLGVALLAAPAAAQASPFQSPSGNIGCFINKRAVRCDIAQKDWPTPPKPKSCQVDYGDGLQLASASVGRSSAPATPTLHQGPVLDYGQKIRRGRFRCKSRTAACVASTVATATASSSRARSRSASRPGRSFGPRAGVSSRRGNTRSIDSTGVPIRARPKARAGGVSGLVHGRFSLLVQRGAGRSEATPRPPCEWREGRCALVLPRPLLGAREGVASGTGALAARGGVRVLPGRLRGAWACSTELQRGETCGRGGWLPWLPPQRRSPHGVGALPVPADRRWPPCRTRPALWPCSHEGADDLSCSGYLRQDDHARVLRSTVSRRGERWFISFTVERSPKRRRPRRPRATVGVDVGIARLATLSTGEHFTNARPLQDALRRSRRLQRQLDRQRRANNPGNYLPDGRAKPGVSSWVRSSRMSRTEKRLRRVHMRAANLRREQAHQLTTHLRARVRSHRCRDSGRAGDAGQPAPRAPYRRRRLEHDPPAAELQDFLVRRLRSGRRRPFLSLVEDLLGVRGRESQAALVRARFHVRHLRDCSRP